MGVNTESLSRGNNDSTLSFDDRLLRTFRNWWISTSSSAGDDCTILLSLTGDTRNLELPGVGSKIGLVSCTLMTWNLFPRGPGLELGDGIGEGMGDLIRLPPNEVSTETGGGTKLGSQLKDTLRDISVGRSFIMSSSSLCLFIVQMALIFFTVSLYACGSWKTETMCNVQRRTFLLTTLYVFSFLIKKYISGGDVTSFFYS